MTQNFSAENSEYEMNNNIINQLITSLNTANQDELLCLKNDKVTFILCKDALKFGERNLFDYMSKTYMSLKTLLQFSVLDKNSEIYKEHIVRTRQKEFLWKYIYKDDNILLKFMYFDDNNDVYIDGRIIKRAEKHLGRRPRMVINENVEKRKFIEGMTVCDYLKDKTYQEKRDMLINMTDTVFDEYDLGNDWIDGVLWDFHWNNVILDNNGKFHFVDKDFVSPMPLKRKDLILYMLRYVYDERLRDDILEYYGCKF